MAVPEKPPFIRWSKIIIAAESCASRWRPLRISPQSCKREAEAAARRVLEALDYVGVLAIELFECDGRLLANEMAPRVHNSGHWSIEGAVTSQFENHLRAVSGLPLGDTRTSGHSAMLNLIGELPESADILAVSDAHLHVYGKSLRPGRKVGHVTLRADSATQLAQRLRQLCQPFSNALNSAYQKVSLSTPSHCKYCT